LGRSGLACTGRAAHPDLKDWPLPLGSDFKKAFAFKLKDLTDDDIETLTNNLQVSDSVRWPRPNANLDNNDSTHSTVWGESCVDKRHFDCIGLVNWCLSTVLQHEFTFGINTFISGHGGTEVPLKQAQPCDIVTIGSQHIGIVTFDGSAIEAKDATSGVVKSPLDAKYWKQCYRLPASTWRFGA
jgi:hypothetical protein